MQVDLNLVMNYSQRFPDSSQNSHEVKIVDKMQGQQICSIFCIVMLVVFMILVSIGGYREVEYPKSLLMLAIIWIIVIPFVFLAFALLKGIGQTRSCTVSTDTILILVPKKFDFSIQWAEIESIQVERRSIQRMRYRDVFYDFHFQGKFEEQLLTLRNDHFTKRKIYQIIDLIEMFAQRLNKPFTKHQI